MPRIADKRLSLPKDLEGALPLLSAETRKNDYVMSGRLPDWNMTYEDYTLSGTVIRKTQDRTFHI